MSDWAKELARAIFLAETLDNGALMPGGYGFLSPETRARYEEYARQVVAQAKIAGINRTPPGDKT